MSTLDVIKEENIASRIYFLRGQNVILDMDLAALYGVETKNLKQAVKRNPQRFPEDFMFVLNEKEIKLVLSLDFVPSKKHLGGSSPFAFTEQGVAMLSGILNSDRANQVNIAIMRTFVQIRKLLSSQKDLAEKINKMEAKYNEQFKLVYTTLRQLILPEPRPRKRIGYKHYDEKKVPLTMNLA